VTTLKPKAVIRCIAAEFHSSFDNSSNGDFGRRVRPDADPR
jgi:hypothetical protein